MLAGVLPLYVYLNLAIYFLDYSPKCMGSQLGESIDYE